MKMGPIIGSFLSDVNVPKQIGALIRAIPGLFKEIRLTQTRSGFKPLFKIHTNTQDTRNTGTGGERPSRAVTTLASPVYKAHLTVPSQQADLQATGKLGGGASCTDLLKNHCTCIIYSLLWQHQPPKVG